MKHANKLFNARVSIIGIVFTLFASACTAENNPVSPDTLLFFEEAVPGDMHASANSQIEISAQQARNGHKSLRWDFTRSSTLTLSRDIGYKPFNPTASNQNRDTFSTWIYNAKPFEGHLLFQFSTDKKLNAFFKVNMNFHGWRSVLVPFETDMQGTPATTMNRLTITAPATIERGRVYFDLMALSMPVDPRWPTADYQVPFVNKQASSRPNAHWTALMQYDRWQEQLDNMNSDPATESELAAVDDIIKLIDQDLLANVKPPARKALKNIHKRFSRMLMQTDDKAQQRLRPVMMGRQLDEYKSGGVAKAQLDFLNSTSVRFKDVGRLMLNVAYAYRTTNTPKAKKELAGLFMYLVKNLEEQGFVRGSGQGIMHHQGYVMGEWLTSLFLMRDVLGEHLNTQRQAMAWYIGTARILKPKDDILGFNVDVMNTFLEGMLYSLLMTPDEQQRVNALRVLSQWMSWSMLNVKGLAGGIQTDGSFYHHSQHYVAYGNGGLNGLTPVVYYLNRTPFQLSVPAHQRLRKAVLMTRIFSNDTIVPQSLSGRHPEGQTTITVVPFKYLAMMGSPGSATGYDKDVAEAYLRLVKDNKKDDFARQLRKKGFVAESDPNGSWVMNYSSLAIHRNDDWLATARGFSRYLVGNETYLNANHYGRYINYGHLEILPAKREQRAFSEPGWDWNRWPGTTTVHLPFDKLAAVLRQEDEFSGIEEMLLSDETFSGGNQLEGQSAMFAMKLHGHPKYDDSFRARKSVFFFENRIVALGSGIENSDNMHETETTLFQDKLTSAKQVTRVGQQALTGLTVNQSMLSDDGFYLLDTNDNAYFLAKGQRVKILRRKQQSYENEHKRETTGNFATALIEHGKAPQHAGYEYAILVSAGEKRARAFAAIMGNTDTAPYRVLQKNNNAHIVYDRATAITAYAMFEATDTVNHGVLSSVSRPVMVMLREDKNDNDESKELRVALVDPDLNLYQGRDESQYDENGKMKTVSIYSRSWRFNDSMPVTVQITLKGHWKAADNATNYKVLAVANNTTRVEVTCVEAHPVQMRFTPQ